MTYGVPLSESMTVLFSSYMINEICCQSLKGLKTVVVVFEIYGRLLKTILNCLYKELEGLRSST